MSRIGKKPITIPKGVTVKVVDGAVEVQGPKGKLRQAFPTGINFELADGHLVAKTATDNADLGKFHGLARSLVANAVAGVVDGFKKELDIVGVGYRAELKGKQVIFALGYSHAVVFDIPAGIDVMTGQTLVSASSAEPSLKTAFPKGVRGGNLKGAEVIGKAIAERSVEKGIKRVVFDRGGFLYHGRIRAIADAARKAGLEF